jgi:predicted DNA-binding protein
MKKEKNKGGRPTLGTAAKRKYIVSTRLDTEYYFRLKALIRQSGLPAAEVMRQLISCG